MAAEDKKPAITLMAFIAFFFTIVSVFAVNKYQFGIGDHGIKIPFLKEIQHNSLYPDDYLMEQIDYFYTFFWPLVGKMIDYSGMSLENVIFGVYFVSLFFTFIAIYHSTFFLFQRQDAAVLSVFLSLFFIIAIGGLATIDQYLEERLAATPFLLYSMYFYFRKSFNISFVLLGIGFLIHPLSASYLLFFLVFSLFIMEGSIGLRQKLMCVAIFFLAASPLLVKKLLYSPESASMLSADLSWLKLMKIRSAAHVFPSTWDKNIFFETLLVLLVFPIANKYASHAVPRNKLYFMVLLSLLLFAAGTIFVEFYPLSIVIQFQLFRGFKWIIFLAIFCYANYFVRELHDSRDTCGKIALPFVMIGVLYSAGNWEYAFIILASVVLFFIGLEAAFQYSLGQTAIVSTILISVFALGLLYGFNFDIRNNQDDEWLDIQHWARGNTQIRDKFIVPPNETGFRVESERTIYGDWKDGTQMFFNPSFGNEWTRRMKNLGYKESRSEEYKKDWAGSLKADYLGLSKDDFEKIVLELRKGIEQIYIVTYAGNKDVDLPVVYQNRQYRVLAWNE